MVSLVDQNTSASIEKKWKRARFPESTKHFFLLATVAGSGVDVFPTCIQDVNRGVVLGVQSAGKVLVGDDYALNEVMSLTFVSHHGRITGHPFRRIWSWAKNMFKF